MSYNYSQINEIIAKQYQKRKGTGSGLGYDNWFLEESIKFGKGYSNPGEYMQAIAKNVVEKSKKDDKNNIIDDKALYIDKNV
jgi:hypothetical protein